MAIKNRLGDRFNTLRMRHGFPLPIDKGQTAILWRNRTTTAQPDLPDKISFTPPLVPEYAAGCQDKRRKIHH
ncbi:MULTISPECIES: hypothetical protein [Erwinia]|uniref:Uncharacterized protein n=1 Tax=Erwinia papayae TaxID=206499 RepID=A0ABV3N415_9GAMM|nr:hypothetical protein [Erwinia mallotivora]